MATNDPARSAFTNNASTTVQRLALFAIPAIAWVLLSTVASADDRPNIALILVDDLGYADVGFNGSPDITTPHLDQLASGGTIFTSAYVCHPFCGPSRMGLMSGRYPHKFGAPFNLPNSGKGIEAFNRMGIPKSETLISTTLQKAGYFTGAVGKWHMGIDPQYHPNRRGFDDYYGFLGGGHMYFPARYAPIYERQKANGNKKFNEYILPLQHNGVEVTETQYMTDALSREAVRFVKEASKEDSPFFLYVAYNAPHMPLEAKEDDIAKFADIKDEKRRTYAAMVYAVDRGVGKLVDALTETGELDNTLIVFLSDNGGKIGGGSNNAPLNQGKGSVCEGGVRVPMFFHWPAAVPKGKRYDHPVSALDFYPTFARLGQADVPPSQQLDGVDIWDALLAGKSARANQPVFALRHWNGFHNVGVRQDGWKLTKRGPKSAWSLFDINRDISESNDVSDKHPEVVEELVRSAKRWSQSHTPPRWYDDQKSQQRWQAQGMPVYDSTFVTP